MNPVLPHEMTGGSAPWELLTAEDVALISGIVARATDFARDLKKANPTLSIIDPDPMLMLMDVSLVHLRRGLDLRAFLYAPIDDFAHELATITRSINRALCTFPEDVKLQFARQKSLFY